MNIESYKLNNSSDLLTPNILLYPELVKENIRMTLKYCKPENLRPHIKTIKNKELIQLLLDEGVSKFKCATLMEAKLLGELKVPDVLIAYPIVSSNIEEYQEIMERFSVTRFQVIVDSIEAAELLNQLALRRKQTVQVFIDLNLGMNRTGVDLEEAYDFVMRISRLNNLKIVGLHGYDGHIQDKGLDVRYGKVRPVLDRLLKIYKELEELLHVKLQLVMGGSNTFPIYSEFPFIECSPGTFMLWDWGYHSNLKEQDYYCCAAVLATRVISKPTSNTVCFDLGYKAVAAENELQKRIYFLEKDDWKAVSQSEEHLVMEVPKTEWDGISVGDLYFAIPYHICPTVAKYPAFMVVNEGEIKENWIIAQRY